MFNCTLCYLENDKDEYLMLHRVKKKNDINHDKWIGVGGKFEANESPEECLLREVREETGLTLTDYRFRGVITFVAENYETEYIYLYTATAWSGELTDCDEGDLEWVPKSRIQDLPIWEGDRVFFKLIEDPNSPVFSLKMEYVGDHMVRAALDGKDLPL